MMDINECFPIDSIEANIDKVDAHVGDAVVELREARANQKTCIIS